MTKDILKGYCVEVLSISTKKKKQKKPEMLHISRLECEEVCHLSEKICT